MRRFSGASMKPNAIDGAANLDFPEVEAWHEFLRFLAIPVPPEVNQDAARELNEAIVDTQPLTQLLNRHRRLAIAKAPLAWRIRVLRRIAQLDPVNPVWELTSKKMGKRSAQTDPGGTRKQRSARATRNQPQACATN